MRSTGSCSPNSPQDQLAKGELQQLVKVIDPLNASAMNSGLAFAHRQTKGPVTRGSSEGPPHDEALGGSHAYCLRRRIACRVCDVERLFLAP